MNTQPPPDMDLEARLRAHYRQPRLAPPDRETIWARLAPHLDARALTPPHAEDEQGLHRLLNHVEHAAPPALLPTPHMPPASRRFFAGVSALAAALVVVLLAVGIFGVFTLLHGGTGGSSGLLDRSKITLLSVSMVSANEGWAVGTTNGSNAQGVILHYHQGRWWQVANPYDTGELRSVFMLSAADGWIVGDQGTILHYTGSTWVKVKSPISTALGSVYMSSSNEGWAMGQDILHYQGGTWNVVSAPEHGFIFSIENASYTGGWAVGGGGTILHYVDGQWQAMSAPKIDLNSVAMVASNVGWAVGSGGSGGNLLHYQDGTWSVVASPAPQETLWSIAIASSGVEGWAVGNTHSDTGLILHFRQGQWTEVPSPTNEFLLGVTLVSAAEGWAVGSHGVIMHYFNSVWSVYTNPVPLESTPTPATGLDLSKYSLNDISMISPDEGWIVGNTLTPVSTGSGTIFLNAGDPVILHYLHGRWTPEALPDYKSRLHCGGNTGACPPFALYSITMVSAEEGWATGSSVLGPFADGVTVPLFLHYTSGKWVLEDPPACLLGSSYIRSANDGWAIGSVADSRGFWRVTLLHYDGKRWSKVDPHIANGRLYSLVFTSPGDGWAVGMQPNTDQHKPTEEDGLLMHYQNGVWEQQPLLKDPFGQNFFSLHGVAMLSPQEGWAVGDEGVLLHYVNGVWERAPSPTSENLSRVTFVSASEGWAIGDHGTILHYHNGAWSLYQSS